MGRLIFGMMQSLDGYIAGPSGELLPPGPILHRYFNDYVRGLDGILYHSPSGTSGSSAFHSANANKSSSVIRRSLARSRRCAHRSRGRCSH